MQYISARCIASAARPVTGTVPSRSILLLGTDLSTGGGVNRVMVDLAHLLCERLGMRVTIASARSAAPSSYNIPDGVALLPGSGGGVPAYLRFLWRLRSQPFDTVVSFWGQDNVLALLMLLGSGKRVVACEHTSFHDTTATVRLGRRILYRFAHAVTVLNRRELAHHARYLSNVTLLPNPIRPLRPARGNRGKVILGIGHLIDRKGFADLVAAYARSGLAREGWALHIVGNGPDRARLQAMIDEHRLDNVAILPPSDDIVRVYETARIIVIPSQIEVFSLVLAEGAMSGLVPLAYDVDGPAYLLERFPDLLVPAGDVTLLAERLSSLCRGDAPDPATIARVIRDLTAPEVIAGQWRSLLA